MRWFLENGTEITVGQLTAEIRGVPRTHFWRLSHMVFIWPEDADPTRSDSLWGFEAGFGLELMPHPDHVEWGLESLDRKNPERLCGRAADGTKAIEDAWEVMTRQREAALRLPRAVRSAR